MVIAANIKSHRPRIQNFIAAADDLSEAINHLVNLRPWLKNFSAADLQNQFAVGVDGNFVRAIKMYFNGARIRTRGNGKIIFQLLLVPMENEVNPGINLSNVDLGKYRQAGLPFGGIAAN